jgi:beta-lactamase regulating signal transducer with metallopeptidase domain
MIAYIIKSTICLVVLYGFFHFFLRQYKILIFNRIYLISSVLFSLIIPLIVLPIKTGLSINTGINNITATGIRIIQSRATMVPSNPHITFENVFFVFLLFISASLLIRFAVNIFNLTIKIRRGEKKEKQETTLVLVDENIIPYSFFKYIFVNRKSYEEGKIERELLLHEEAHCLQYHSLDIILLEVINIFFWFNPSIWLFRKAIQLNHEYYADNRVLTNSDSEEYHQLLVNLVLQNNISYLVSNFKYSLIKSRLIMMTKNIPSGNAILRKITAISFVLILGIVFTLSQANNSLSVSIGKLNQKENATEDWWKPIVKKHGIKFEPYIIHENYLIIGEITLKDGIQNYKNSIAIKNDIKTYWIYKFKSATYDNKSSQLNIYGCTMEKFDMNSDSKEPLSSYGNMTYKINLITKRGMMADTIPY